VEKKGIRKILLGLKSYLTDWRNLLGHALLGTLFLVVAIWAPLKIWIKLLIIAGLVAFNIIRMRRKANQTATEEKEEVEE
jgi:hypothetical protein